MSRFTQAVLGNRQIEDEISMYSRSSNNEVNSIIRVITPSGDYTIPNNGQGLRGDAHDTHAIDELRNTVTDLESKLNNCIQEIKLLKKIIQVNDIRKRFDESL